MFSRFFTSLGIVGILLAVSLPILAIIGWIKNVIWVYHADFSHITGQLVISVVGILPLAPIGAVLGWFH